MSVEAVRKALAAFGWDGDILRPEASTATVELAAKALGTQPARIAKTLAFYDGKGAILVVAAGDVRVDNRKFKERFGFRAKMLSGEDVARLTGHAPGGVCPFALPEGASVYLDTSLRRFDAVYPACGDAGSAIRLTLAELERFTGVRDWVDVTKHTQA